MKKSFRTFLLLTIALLYSFLTSAYGKTPAVDQSSLSELKHAERVHFNSELVPNLYCHFGQSVHSGTLFNHVAPVPFKKSFNPVYVYCKVRERGFFHAFAQYDFYAQKVLVRLQRTDIIFPFHFFW